jgi:hypothetical protein
MYECVEGQCVLACQGLPPALDCDGLPDNGCEIKGVNNDHCGACGVKCTDPNKPCIARSPLGDSDMGCGCKGDQLFCPTNYPPCVDGKNDDNNCGACGNTCDPNGDGGAPHSTMYYGCYAGECGHLKCMPNVANCDGDEGNGCETDIFTKENCGGCGLACAAGQECRLDSFGTPSCMCPAGETFCPQFCFNGLCMGGCLLQPLVQSRELWGVWRVVQGHQQQQHWHMHLRHLQPPVSEGPGRLQRQRG